MEVKKALFPCDLHGHTTRSDGNDTPAEYLQHAASRGVQIVAITDHDVVPPKEIEVNGHSVPLQEYAGKLGVSVIPGIEISCETTIEDAHFVCFGCDWDAPYFRELQAFVAASKIRGYQELCNRLTAMGMLIDWDELLNNHGTPIEASAVQKKMIFNYMAEKGYTPDWSEAKKLVKRTPELSIQREKPSAVSVIQAVHKLGGVVIMAHPYLVAERVSYEAETISRWDYIEKLIDAGLDGIEARYTYDKTSYAGIMSKSEIEQDILRRYAGRMSIISGGSDYHADGKKGVLNYRDIGECGLTMEEFRNNPILCELAGLKAFTR